MPRARAWSMLWRPERNRVAGKRFPSTPRPFFAAASALLLFSACRGDAPAPNRDGPFPASSAAVLLDGELDEWTAIPPLIEDASDGLLAHIRSTHGI